MLKLTQRSMWNRWLFDLSAADGEIIGEIGLSDHPQATNARLRKVSPTEAEAGKIHLAEGSYRIRYEWLRRGLSNDAAWWLESQAGATLARVEQQSTDFSVGKHQIILPESGELRIIKGRFSPIDARLFRANGSPILRICEPGWFSVKRILHIEGDAWTPAIRAFMAYYVLECLT
jgi:hypothetical protein